jgi:transposase
MVCQGAIPLRLLARRVPSLSAETNGPQGRIEAVVADHRPAFLARYGLVLDTAATLLITVGNNPTGCDLKLLRLPVRCMSCRSVLGNTGRRLPSRGGGRRANAALYRTVLSDPLAMGSPNSGLHTSVYR